MKDIKKDIDQYYDDLVINTIKEMIEECGKFLDTEQLNQVRMILINKFLNFHNGLKEISEIDEGYHNIIKEFE